MTTLLNLKKGDLFKFGKNSWDAVHRFHSLEKKGKQYYIFFISLNYLGDIESAKWNSYTWRDSNVEIFIPKYLLSEQKRTNGKPCIPVSNRRIVFPYLLNEINLTEKYCKGNNYWYDEIIPD